MLCNPQGRLPRRPNIASHRERLTEHLTANRVKPNTVAPEWTSIEREDDGPEVIRYLTYIPQ